MPKNGENRAKHVGKKGIMDANAYNISLTPLHMTTTSCGNDFRKCARQVGLSLMVFFHVLSPCGAASAESQVGAVSGQENPQISFHNERLSIRAKSVPLADLVDSIAKMCDLRIFAASAEKTNKVVNVDMTDWEVDKALANLLKGCNYLVVYNEAQEKTGLMTEAGISADTGLDVAPSSAPKTLPSQTGEALREQQITRIQRQIEMLSQRIESGASDRLYQNAIKTKKPAFVQDDRKLLANYQKQLARLESGRR